MSKSHAAEPGDAFGNQEAPLGSKYDPLKSLSRPRATAPSPRPDPQKGDTSLTPLAGQNGQRTPPWRRAKGPRQKNKSLSYTSSLRVFYPTSEERDDVVRASVAAGFTSASAYLLALSRGPDYKYKSPRDPELTRALFLVNRQLTVQGHNLKQIKNKFDMGILTPAQAASLLHILTRSLLQTHKAVRQALGRGEPEP